MFDIQKEQALEALFTQAAKEPAYRPEFLKQLLDADIYVVGHSNKDADTPKQIQEMTLTEGSQVQIKSWNKADGSSKYGSVHSLDFRRSGQDLFTGGCQPSVGIIAGSWSIGHVHGSQGHISNQQATG